jgi:hypothetical protein
MCVVCVCTRTHTTQLCVHTHTAVCTHSCKISCMCHTLLCVCTHGTAVLNLVLLNLVLKVKRYKFQIDATTWCPRETLKKRLEKTPSNARCFAQGSPLLFWPILECPMGTAHGAEELGLRSHGPACRAGAWGHHYKVMPRIWPYLGNPNK